MEPLPPAESVKEADRQSLTVLYQVTVADIAFFKQQQWAVMNYAVGLDAALIFVAQQPAARSPNALSAWALLVLAFAIPAVAMLALKRLRNSIESRRIRLAQTRALLGPVFLQAWKVQKEPDDFYFVFVGVLACSWLVTLWLVWPRV